VSGPSLLAAVLPLSQSRAPSEQAEEKQGWIGDPLAYVPRGRPSKVNRDVLVDAAVEFAAARLHSSQGVVAVEQGSESWRLARFAKITGTSAASVISAHQDKTTVAAQILQLACAVPETDAMEYGRTVERDVINVYLDQHPESLAVYPAFMTSADHPSLGYSPDAVLLAPPLRIRTLVEVKTTTTDKRITANTYKHQLQLGLLVSGFPRAILIVFHSPGIGTRPCSDTITVHDVVPDPVWRINFLAKAKQFRQTYLDWCQDPVDTDCGRVVCQTLVEKKKVDIPLLLKYIEGL
jgi:hypothetical protein